MSSAPQIKRLAKPLLQRHNDLIMATGNIMAYLPVTHWNPYIRIHNRPKRGNFTVDWWVDTRFEPGHYAFISRIGACSLIGRSLKYRPRGRTGLFEWDDPTMPGDFIDQVEARILPVFSSLDTLEKTIAHLRAHQHNSFAEHPPWKTLMHVALGEIPAAQAEWRNVMHNYVPRTTLSDPSRNYVYDQWCLLTEPLMAGDRAALARLPHGWEAENTIGTNLEPYWRSTPFPLEHTHWGMVG
ncbi:hypothetical protein GCM10007890_31160 [Methylobacterium tardum]|uniref:Uncharacterized protein n=2 Tax=Methylobacterium tardum TaxID=374432 RepID=A0AA37TN67_9HYPH|nr:hypothetical protein GCM10007890_31160 [Methylobacterium tardum]